MKKTYESPRAEKMEFNYSETVVASSTVKCDNTTTYTQSNDTSDYCNDVTVAHEKMNEG